MACSPSRNDSVRIASLASDFVLLIDQSVLARRGPALDADEDCELEASEVADEGKEAEKQACQVDG